MPASIQPAGRNGRWSCGELVDVVDVAPEEASVVDDAGDHAISRGGGGVEDELARPGLERIEDHHRPVDPLAEALEAVEQVEREAVCRAGGDADRGGDAVVAERRHAVPDGLGGVAGVVGVVEEEEVEAVLAESLEALLRRHPQVAGVRVGSAQPRVREPREALRADPLTLVEVMADRADEAVGAAIDAGDRAAEHPVGLALTVGVGGQHRRDAVAGPEHCLEPLLVDPSPKFMKRPPLQVPTAVVPGSSPVLRLTLMAEP